MVARSPRRGEALPLYDDVEFQPLAAQVRRVVEALDQLGQPLTNAEHERVDRAFQAPKNGVAALQEALDPLCLIGLEINPESRVKAVQGAAPARLMKHGWRVFLVKVHNQAGVTAALRRRQPERGAALQRIERQRRLPKRPYPSPTCPIVGSTCHSSAIAR